MSPSRINGLAIVVVEDHDDARRYLDLFLRQLGAKVIVAANSFEGLELIKHSPPDLVLSDIKMPGMDGFELPGFRRLCAGYSNERLFLADRTSAHTLRRFSGLPAQAVHSRRISERNSGCSLSRLPAGGSVAPLAA